MGVKHLYSNLAGYSGYSDIYVLPLGNQVPIV